MSYFEILKSYIDGKRSSPTQIDLTIIKDKACFIGLTAAGASDLKAIPLENIYPMLGLQASVFNSIINNDFISGADRFLNIFISVFIFVLSLLISMRFSALKALTGNLILGIVYFLISVAFFIFWGVWVDLFLPVLIIGLTYIGVTSYRFFDEARKRQLLEKELDIAAAIQKSFLPEDIKELYGIEISSFIEPAKFVAGDLYDIFAMADEKIGVFIGDVSGKGVSASLIMAQTISLFRLFSRQYSSCSEVLQRLNKELYGKATGRFITCLYMIVDMLGQKAIVSSAGHSPVLVYKSADKTVSEIELSADIPLGIKEETEYRDVVFDIHKGDRLIVFTDGLPEARNVSGQEFGIGNVKDAIAKGSDIKDELFRFSHRATQHDDITLITLSLPHA
jgi:hypothetical protein